MIIEHNKLIRDNIPCLIEESGHQYQIEILTEEEYRHALFDKLIEEAQEIVISTPENLMTEIADLYEVIDAIIQINNISEEEVRRKQAQKREARGGFKKRIRLLWTSDEQD